MGNSIKKALELYGVQLVDDPARFHQAIVEQGGSEKEGITAELILSECPSVRAMLTAQSASAPEINLLYASVIRKTELSPAAVRRTLGDLLRAFDKDAPETFRYMGQYKAKKAETAAAEKENEVCEEAETALLSPDEEVRARALNDLENLSEAGSGKASYLSGMHFYKADAVKSSGVPEGEPYFRKAGAQGFGPANGALAWYAARKGFMTKAASLYDHPASLSGKEGREWRFLGDTIRRYKNNNVQAYKKALIVSIIVFVLSLALVVESGASVFALILSGLCAAWCVIGRRFFPCVAVNAVYFVLMISFLIQVLAIF